MSDSVRVSFEEMHRVFSRVLCDLGIEEARALRCAEIFAENTRDGVVSHGLNRFPGFVDSVKSGLVDPVAKAEQVSSMGAIEQWDGRRGIGPLNAETAMKRAIALARANGMGCVGLRNNNHWMRGGSYGLMAAEENSIGICWTNTIALMPPWGAIEKRVGNNPLVVCIPRKEGPVLLDMAMSQFSNGKLEVLTRSGQQLPMVGGYDGEGKLTTDPQAILASQRALPIGFWKGSGLALALDLMGTLIAGGDSTLEISRREQETRVSQVFMAIHLESLGSPEEIDRKVNAIVEDFCAAVALDGASDVRYPGEGMLARRRESLARGISVDAELWNRVLDM